MPRANTIWLSANSATLKTMTGVTSLDWAIGTVGDFDGDERSDLMWRNGRTGANVIWLGANSRQLRAVSTIDTALKLVH